MFIDISPPIWPGMPVWPGDTTPTREVLADRANGDAVTLSTLRATVHLGAHADAPSHYGVGPSIEQIPLDRFLGPCQVVRVNVPPGGRVTPYHVADLITEPRLLIATNTFQIGQPVGPSFASLTPELIFWLHDQGVNLVGVDTPSVDALTDDALPVHRACGQHDVLILEWLDLARVPDGHYELIALPLPLVGFEASPIRAVLRSLPESPTVA